MNPARYGCHSRSIALHIGMLLPKVGCAIGADALSRRYRPPVGGHGRVDLPFTALEQAGAALSECGWNEHGNDE